MNTQRLLLQNKNAGGHSIKLFGNEFLVHKGVFSPVIFSDAYFLAIALRKHIHNDMHSFLEIGCGSGIASVCVGINRDIHVVASDISEQARDNTHVNLINFAIEHEAVTSNLFENISKEKTFDAIYWNHPFNNGETSDVLDHAVYDNDYESLRQFLIDAPAYLNESGRIYLGTSSLCAYDLEKNFSDVYTFDVLNVGESQNRPGVVLKIVCMELNKKI